MVTAPTNKAIAVLALRFMQAIQHGKNNNLKIVLVGDPDKLLDVEEAKENRTKTNQKEQASIRSIFLYHFLSNLQAELQSFKAHLKGKVASHNTNNSNEFTHHSWSKLLRLLNQFVDIGSLFPANVKENAENLQTSLLKGKTTTAAIARNAKQLPKLVDKLLQDVNQLEQGSNNKKGLINQVHRHLVGRADVIFCTLAAAGSSVFKSQQQPRMQRPRALIVDEAAAATEPELAIPFYLEPERLLLVGDPRQLPATVLSHKAKALGLDQSLHQRLMDTIPGGYPYTMLETQYRMRPVISEFPSRQFYNGKLKNSPRVEWYDLLMTTVSDWHVAITFSPSTNPIDILLYVSMNDWQRDLCESFSSTIAGRSEPAISF